MYLANTDSQGDFYSHGACSLAVVVSLPTSELLHKHSVLFVIFTTRCQHCTGIVPKRSVLIGTPDACLQEHKKIGVDALSIKKTHFTSMLSFSTHLVNNNIFLKKNKQKKRVG